MPHRELLTQSQRLSFQAPASDERGIVRHYTLSSEDLDHRSLIIYTIMTSSILYFQRNTTGAALISSKY